MKKKLVGLSVVILFLLLSLTNAQAAILKVGSEWSGTTYATIQDAVTAASDSDEIWVEQGTYTLSSTILINKSVSLYGGFTGLETSREQRNATAHVTTVDGNNRVRCFNIFSTTEVYVTIDGFTISKGLTDSSTNGAGISNGNYGSNIPSYLTVANCILTLNNSGKHGGAIYNDVGGITVTNSILTQNTAANKGGAISNYALGAYETMNLTGCAFVQNSAGNAGAIYVANNPGTNVINGCSFTNNQANPSGTGDGGAILCDATITVNKCIFDQNASGRTGTFGARGDTGRSAIFANCIFSNNSGLNGAGICINGTSGALGVVTATNCTFSGNTLKSGGKGGAIYTSKPTSDTNTVFTVTNCILWGNAGNAIDRAGTTQPLPKVSYTDIDQTGYAGTITDSINADPLFVDATNGDYHLQGTSPCINTATGTGGPSDDLEGTSRPQGAGFDMGAYEYMVTLVNLSSFKAIPGNGKVSLTWTTESEIDNAGFNIYRADADGEFARINDELIPAQGSATGGATYVFVDKDVQNRATYSYTLEDVDVNGVSTFHGPVYATPRLMYGLTGK